MIAAALNMVSHAALTESVVYSSDQTTAAIVVGIVGGLLLLIPDLIVSGAIGTFNHAYWTLAYLRPTVPIEELDPQPGEGA